MSTNGHSIDYIGTQHGERVYLHHFGTGNQELVFKDDAAAKRWLAADIARIHQKQGSVA